MADESEEYSEDLKGCNANDPYDWRRKRHEVDKVNIAHKRCECMFVNPRMEVIMLANHMRRAQPCLYCRASCAGVCTLLVGYSIC